MNSKTKKVSEQPAQQQEPMAWIYDWFADDEIEGERVIHDWVTTDYDEAHCSTNGCHNIRPLYTHPPRREWVSLTDYEVVCIEEQHSLLDFARVVEALLKEKNCA